MQIVDGRRMAAARLHPAQASGESEDRFVNLFDEFKQNITRRYFFAQGSHVLGAAALATLAGRDAFGAERARLRHEPTSPPR